MKLKVCGMRDEGNIQATSSLSPDFIGFIFYEPSPRNAFGITKKAISNIPSTEKKVAVFVNEDLDKAEGIIDTLGFEYVQLHGNESPTYCRALRNKGLGVFKVFSIDAEVNFKAMEDYLEVCDYFLFDTKSPKHGGTGMKFDWKLLDNYPFSKPVILSGGIGPEDAPEIIELIKKHTWIQGLDLNSKFETAPGIKDTEKLSAFFSQIRKEAAPTGIK